MTQTVTALDGTVHSFPDEATPDMIAKALGIQPPTPQITGIRRELALPALNYTQGLIQGLGAPEDVTQAATGEAIPRGKYGSPAVPSSIVNQLFERLGIFNRPDLTPQNARERYEVAGARGAGAMTPFVPISGPGALVAGATGGLGQQAGQELFPEHPGLGGLAGGVIGGALGPSAWNAATRIVSPQLNPNVQTLLEAGVKPTAGQVAGPAISRLEQAATSVPLAGDVVKGALVKANRSFNEATINHALAPIGESLDKGTPVGREAISQMRDKIGGAYDNLLPKLTLQVDKPLIDDIANLRTAAQTLPPDRANQFDNLLKYHVLDRLSQQGTIPGQQYKEIESTLGQLARDYRYSSSADERNLGDSVLELKNALRDNLTRSNPQYADQLGQINSAYARMLRVEGAAASTGAKEGVFSPAQLFASTRRLDPSLRKTQFARGDALMQNLAEAGKSVMGSTVPDSGTPFRGAALTALGLLGAHQMSPQAAMGAAAAGGGVAGLYTPWMQTLLRAAMTQRPEVARNIGTALRLQKPNVPANVAAMFPNLLTGETQQSLLGGSP